MSDVTVRLTKDKQAIDIFDDRLGPENPYYVELDRIRNEAELLGWAIHLSEKMWMTARAIGEFLDIAAEAKGFKVTR